MPAWYHIRILRANPMAQAGLIGSGVSLVEAAPAWNIWGWLRPFQRRLFHDGAAHDAASSRGGGTQLERDHMFWRAISHDTAWESITRRHRFPRFRLRKRGCRCAEGSKNRGMKELNPCLEECLGLAYGVSPGRLGAPGRRPAPRPDSRRGGTEKATCSEDQRTPRGRRQP